MAGTKNIERYFMQRAQNIAEAINRVIAIDGRTLRGSHDTARKEKAIHMVSAPAAENKLILGQLATDTKSNKTTVIPLLLNMLDIQGATVTTDAAGCQKDKLKKIRYPGSHYLTRTEMNLL
nr:ISAs1 family transposase [Neochlamydia sp. EPS4]